MKILVSLGPIIGVIIIALYGCYVKLRFIVKGKEKSANCQKKIYIYLLVLEVALILISVFVPKITGESYLIDGMTRGGKTNITPTAFEVSYEESKRNYSNTLELSKEELDDIRVSCSAEEGKVFLRITQDDVQTTVDITNTEAMLDLSDFKEGNIRFTLLNEEAKNVKFVLFW